MTHTCIEAVLQQYPQARPEVIRAFEESTRNDNWLVRDARSRQYEHH